MSETAKVQYLFRISNFNPILQTNLKHLSVLEKFNFLCKPHHLLNKCLNSHYSRLLVIILFLKIDHVLLFALKDLFLECAELEVQVYM